MDGISILYHRKGAPGLRLLGLGPGFTPRKGLKQLKDLFDKNTFWAQSRTNRDLKIMLKHSSEIVSVWNENTMVGFGRATTDNIYRAVIWDIVVESQSQGSGLGRVIIDAILSRPSIALAEKVYLMTTKRSDFYKQMGFESNHGQTLLVINSK